MSANDYQSYRRTPDSETFFQIRGSATSPFKEKVMRIPSILLPSMISAFVAKSAEDIYLSINFDVFAQCGSPIPVTALGGQRNGEGDRPSYANNSCSRAIDNAITAYRQNKLVK